MAVWKRFEEMHVWKKSCQLACVVYEETREGEVAKDFGFRDQIRRSAVSVASNIAEGFERGSDNAFANFLAIAKGSSGELRTQLYIAGKLGYIDSERMNALVAQAEEISKMLFGLIKHLKPSY
jgi:four helix bundle protein